jgi:hypothetical protein
MPSFIPALACVVLGATTAFSNTSDLAPFPLSPKGVDSSLVPLSGSWQGLEGDTLKTSAIGKLTRILIGDSSWSNYTVTLETRTIGWGGELLFLFGVQGPEHHYSWAQFQGWEESNHLQHNGKLLPATKKRSPSRKGKEQEWHQMKIQVTPGLVRCFADGVPQQELTGQRDTTGYFGLGSTARTTGFLEFRKIKVTGPKGDILFKYATASNSIPAISFSQALQEVARREDDVFGRTRFRDLIQSVYPLKSSAFFGQDGFDAWLNAPETYAQQRLTRILSEETPGAAARSRSAYAAFELAYDTLVRQARRRSPPIVFIERERGARRGTNATMFSQIAGRGAKVCVFYPATGKTVTLYETTEGQILDLSPDCDGKRILFTMRKKEREPFHTYELTVASGQVEQLNDGPWHDYSPVYYPDGRIVFSSSRVESFSMCQNFIACALYAMQGDGSDIRRFDFTTLSTLTPAVMPDGSIICSRWEYQDKNIFSWQGLWTINPNGTQLKLYYGNTVTIPNSLYGPKPIPGTDKVLYVMAAHHHPPIGDIAIVERSRGIENTGASRKLTFATPYEFATGTDWRDNRNWQPGDKYFANAFTDPYPINSDFSIASYGYDDMQGFGLVAVYHHGFVVPFHEMQDKYFYSPAPLAKREKPPAVPGDCAQEEGEGTFFVQDVYQGLLEQGVTRGQVKQLRIWEQVPKKYNTEAKRVYDHYPAIGFGTYYVKNCYGTVPVDENGAAHFRAPSNRELYFQALDKDGKEIQRMGSVTQITTGEKASCIGCHEDRLSAPVPNPASMERLDREPDRITPPPWGAGPIDYVKMVQPILDRNCVECHSGTTPKGRLDLSGDKNRFFNMSFSTLCSERWIDYYWINAGPTGVFPALRTGSWTSKLTHLLEKGHHKISLTENEERALYAWIDSNAIYYGTWDMSRPHSIGGRDTWAAVPDKADTTDWFRTEPAKWGSIKPAEWFVTVEKIVTRRDLSGLKNGLSFEQPRARSNLKINLTRPHCSHLLLENLAESAGGWSEEEDAVFRTKEDSDYIQLLAAIQAGADALTKLPRMDMPNAKAVPQRRDFVNVR